MCHFDVWMIACLLELQGVIPREALISQVSSVRTSLPTRGLQADVSQTHLRDLLSRSASVLAPGFRPRNSIYYSIPVPRHTLGFLISVRSTPGPLNIYEYRLPQCRNFRPLPSPSGFTKPPSPPTPKELLHRNLLFTVANGQLASYAIGSSWQW